MRHAAVFCAVTLGVGCGASAAEQGLASFYGIGRAGDLTAAHRTLPMGARVKILNLDNGRVAVVRIVDRGPFIRGRIIDVSRAAAATLGFREAGLAHVKIVPVREETAAEPRPEAQAKPAAYEKTAYDICRYNAGGLDRLEGGPVGGEKTPPSNRFECKSFRPRLFSLESEADDWTAVAAAAVASTPAKGLEAAASIPVIALAEVIAAESISVGALLPPPEHGAALTREQIGCTSMSPCNEQGELPASKPALSLLARLSRIFD
jgi:rare lipoprotein A